MADAKISALPASTTPLAGSEVLPIVQSSATKKVSVANLTAGRAVSAASLTTTGAVSAASLGATGIVSAGTNLGVGKTPAEKVDIYGATAHEKFIVKLCDGASANYSEFQVKFGTADILTWGGGASAYADKTTLAGTGSLALKVGASDRLSISSAGNVTANNGNLVVGTAGKGIDFSANGGDVLSQYDEGTWTPLDFSGAGLTLTAAGSYTRIGRMVFFSAEITYPVTANAAWAAINGLPFARSAGAVGGGTSLLAAAGKGYTFPLLSGATGGYLYKIDDQGTHALNSDLSGQTIQISGSYTV